MFETKNRIEIVGKVRNFKISETKNGKKLANIGIKDESKNNYVNVTLFERKNMKYDGKEVTLNGLKKIFLDANDTTKNVLVTAVGVTSEYTNDEEKTYSNNTVFSLFPCDKEEKQKATYVLQGIVESVATVQDENDEDYLKIKVATLNTTEKDGVKKVTGVNYKTVVIRDKKLVEKMEDAEKGDLVSLKGYIVNILPERDEFGDFTTQGRQEYETVKAKIVKESDELEEEDVAVYKKAKSLKAGDSIVLKAKNKDDDDDFED